jgi:hypothetical protein
MRSSRRDFLALSGGALVLAACSGTSNSTVAASTTTAAGTAAGGTLPAKFGVVQRFPSSGLFVPGEVRLPVSLSDGQKLLQSGPAELKGRILDFKGNKVVDVVGMRRDKGIANPYWEVRAQLDKAVIYTLRFDGDDGYGATFELFEPAQVQSPLTGKPMPPFDTPTKDNHRGVEPYCSRPSGPCPLHDITLTEALKKGKPVAYMVGTPGHCQTGTCAPGLEALMSEHELLGDQVMMVHADVYADNAATKVSPAVESLHVDYEPIIYFIDAKGIVVDRLDGVWDGSELRERLAKLTA